MTDSKELIAELRGKEWMVNCEMRGLIPDDTAERAAAHIAALEARIDADTQTIATLRADLAEAVEGLEDLAEKEAEYRHEHDVYGAGNIMTGRAWDRMRYSGNRARSLIKELKP